LVSVTLIQASYRFDFWIISTSCSGDSTWYYEADNNDCGTSTGQSFYSKVAYELGTGNYDIYEYSDQQCQNQINHYTVQANQVNQCVSVLLSSYKFQFFVNCFPADSTVQVDNQNVKLSDLNVGQSIKSYDGYTTTSSEVYTFLDYNKDALLDYVELQYLEENGSDGKIAISAEHLILAKRSGKQKFVQSKDVQVGDYIFKSSNGTVVPVVVSSSNIRKYKGAIAPATMTGTLIVNNIITSSYAAIDHDISHATLAPLRWAYRINPNWVNAQTDGKAVFKGMHPYTEALYNFFTPRWILNPPHLIAPHTLD